MGIKEFYDGCDIFITGGTGFMGKVLIEKLLRSCPGIRNIYVLMRQSKDKCITERVKDILALPLFDKIRTEHPGVAESKIIPVSGDLSEIRLGMSDDDYNMLVRNVSVVFHVAATVRFDEPIRDAIIKNVRGTREVVGLAAQMKNLRVFLHVSTTYCNCNRIYVDEKVYESPISWQDAILIAENLNPKLSETLTTKLLGLFPNTYTFTKLLAEQIVNERSARSTLDDSNNMPMVIFRPSIVISTISEPLLGWIDNFNGPVGLMLACGKGLTLVTLAHKDSTPDFMAVDVSIKAMIVAAYHRGTHNSSSDNPLTVYNCSSVKKSITNSKLMQFAVKYFMLHPFDEILWRPRILITGSKRLFHYLTIIQQVLPAMLIDFVLKTTGQPQPISLVKLQRKIYIATMALSTFTLQTWTFKNTNFLDLLTHIPDDEKDDFDFRFDDLNVEDAFITCLTGAQKYLFNTNPNKIKQAKKKLKKLVWIDRLLITLFFVVIAYCFYSIILSLSF
ncbi:putative fatty acyl-CoA reductase CG5065 isoform X1 [Myzus persicae]|uniref:putative fatty acyl-CoA reductase CG5065 isoform X1 n=1 Tax=Myzus persicae TaxID=13164 RepID=UPI000B92FBED|nr:putative fatty acyl-CoA reductase CG5065 isoform X1 [Myzus persicae]